ncbi:MAG TPA: dihydroorotate dehydrogenase, partial [Thermoleophilaceae bacterium]|nr:dihydroorotate dehydrogenase [Thermoleophilaceae bacterium]
DGSVGRQALVTEPLAQALDAEPSTVVFACGPPEMLEAVRILCTARGVTAQLALEAGMACGFGACFGCVVPTSEGYVRLCVDGPVLDAERLEGDLPRGRAASAVGARSASPGATKAGAPPARSGAGPPSAGPVELCGVHLGGPVLNGSGTFDAIAARRAFGDALLERFPFHAFVSKTITLEPRQGNSPPRLWETPAGLINSIGLPNKGLAGFIASDLPELAELPVPLVVSLMGFSRDELAQLVTALGRRDEVAMIELNFSCPNVETGLVMGADPGESAAAVERVRPLTDKPLIVKLTPNASEPAAVARASEEAGADAVSLINTLKGMALAPDAGRPWLGGTTGGVSGPAVRAIALEQVHSVAGAVRIPVIGMGGIGSGRHAADLLAAGAAAVAVGTESFRDPAAGRRVAAELAELQRAGAEPPAAKSEPLTVESQPPAA